MKGDEKSVDLPAHRIQSAGHQASGPEDMTFQTAAAAHNPQFMLYNHRKQEGDQMTLTQAGKSGKK